MAYTTSSCTLINLILYRRGYIRMHPNRHRFFFNAAVVHTHTLLAMCVRTVVSREIVFQFLSACTSVYSNTFLLFVCVCVCNKNKTSVVSITSFQDKHGESNENSSHFITRE